MTDREVRSLAKAPQLAVEMRDRQRPPITPC